MDPKLGAVVVATSVLLGVSETLHCNTCMYLLALADSCRSQSETR